jgi:glycosyltransferase involved in cell wall biosynthesis
MRYTMLVTTTYSHDSRVRRAAEALANIGHEVHVICTRPLTSEVGSVETLHGVTIHRPVLNARDVPAAMLRPFRRSAGRSGPVRVPARAKLGGTLTSTFARMMATPLLMLHRVAITRRMSRVATRLQPDIIHAHDPDTLPAAGKAARAGASIIYDAHELATGRSNVFGWERWMDARSEARWIPRTSGVITVSPGIADILKHRHGRDVEVIRNIPVASRPTEPPPDLRRQSGIPPEALLVLHQGLRSPQRGLATLLDAIALIPDAHLVLLGDSVRGMDVEIQRRSSQLRLDARVHVLPPVPPEMLISVTSQADVGVSLLEDTSVNHRLALPNKLFEYLLAGIPVVASDLPEIRRLIEEVGGGVLCDASDAGSVARAITAAADLAPPVGAPTGEEEMQRLLRLYERVAGGRTAEE